MIVTAKTYAIIRESRRIRDPRLPALPPRVLRDPLTIAELSQCQLVVKALMAEAVRLRDNWSLDISGIQRNHKLVDIASTLWINFGVPLELW